jgi:hypothetical protein
MLLRFLAWNYFESVTVSNYNYNLYGYIFILADVTDGVLSREFIQDNVLKTLTNGMLE